MKTSNLNIISTYVLFSKIIIFVILTLFLFLLYFNFSEIGLKCNYKLLYGVDCKSCGITRGLSKCINGEFNEAKNYNSKSTILFLLLLINLFFRVGILSLYKFSEYNFKKHFTKIIALEIIIMILTIIFY